VSLWQRYWFAPGGRHSNAALRIAIATSVLWTVWRLTASGYVADPDSAPAQLYRPIGILMLLGSNPPPTWLIDGMKALAWVATTAMLVGWRSRATTVVSWVCAVGLACFHMSFTATWSHQNTLPFLVHLAFLGARGADVWSVDAWLRRRRGQLPINIPGGYQCSVRLAQLSVGLMFFSAAMAKLFFGDFTLAWVFSDNLRHQLLARFDWIGAPQTPIAAWLLLDVWHYRVAAGLNLLAQLTPLTAVVLVHRPLLRALAGSVFVVEVVALGLVMDLWNLHWLPLAAVFVDWDRLRSLVARRSQKVAVQDCPVGASPPRARLISTFVALFLSYDAVVAFGLDQRLRTYPFSAYPMFGYVRAKRPYDQHLTYEMPGASVEIVSDQLVDADAQAWIDRHYTFRLLYQVRTADLLATRLQAAVTALQQEFPALHVRGVRVYFTVFYAPAYPAPAQLRRHRVALLGEYINDQLTSALGTVRADSHGIAITPRWVGMAAPASVSYQAVVDYGLETVPLVVEVQGDGVSAPRPPGASVMIVAAIGAKAFVVGELGKRRW
jgi:hypothetical protein